MERKRGLIYLGIIFASLAIIWVAFLLPAMGDKKVADTFAEPLFTHALPEGAEQVQQEADRSKTDGGKMTAAYLLLSADATEDELYTFYNDVDYPPAQEGDTVTLHVQPLDDASLDALEQGGLDDRSKTDGGKMTAAYLLLSADATEDELYTFYNDVDYPPAQEGDTVTLHVQPLDDASLDALEQGGLDVEGKSYWFVYLVSQPA